MNAVQYIILASPETTPMSHGKAAAQAAHASVEGYRLTDPTSNLYKDWYVGGHHTKIVLQADDVVNAKMYLENRGIKCALIIDEGRTEFDADLTPTAVGCALVNKDNPHIQATFSAFKLYKAPPKYVILEANHTLKAADYEKARALLENGDVAGAKMVLEFSRPARKRGWKRK